MERTWWRLLDCDVQLQLFCLFSSTALIIKCWAGFGVSWEWIIGRKALLVGTGIMSCNGGLVSIIFWNVLTLQDEQTLTAHINF